MKRLFIDVYIDYLMCGHRAGDFEYKIQDTPWVFTVLLTIQLYTIELLLSNLFGFFNPEYGVTFFLATFFLSLILIYSNKRIFKKMYNDVSKEGEIRMKVFYKNKFIIMTLLSLLMFYLMFYYALIPYMK
jgi:hypothetical protein